MIHDCNLVMRANVKNLCLMCQYTIVIAWRRENFDIVYYLILPVGSFYFVAASILV